MPTKTKKSTRTRKTSAGTKKPGRKIRASENPHPRKLKGTLLLEFRAASFNLELRRQKLESTNAHLDTLSMDPSHAKVFSLLAQREGISTDIRDAVLEFAVVQKKLADKFGIPLEKLHEYTFDTDSGAITPSRAVT